LLEEIEMTDFADYMDTSRRDALLGEMLGAFAELEAEGHGVLAIADAAVMAAIRKVHLSQPGEAAHAWSLRLRDLMAAGVDGIDDAATAAAQRRQHRRLN